MSNVRAFLDVEDDEQRQNRIGTLLERLNTTSLSSPVPQNPLPSTGIPEQPTERTTPTPIVQATLPSPAVLARVQAFLPAISASNEALSQQRSEDINIEHVPEDEERYIEMNLGLGVFEARPRPGSGKCSPSPSSDAESLSGGSLSESQSDSEVSRSASGSEDTNSSNDDSEDEGEWDTESQSGSSIDMKPIVSRPIKPLPRRVSQQTNKDINV